MFLDRSQLSHSYEQCLSRDIWITKTIDIAKSGSECLIISMSTACIHQMLVSFTTDLSMKHNKSFLSKNTITVIADIGIISLAIALELPLWVAGAYAFSAASKSVLPCILNKLPNTIRASFNNDNTSGIKSISGLFALNLSYTYFQGGCLTASTIDYGCSLGGNSAGLKLAKTITKVPKKLSFFPAPKPRESLCTRISNWFCRK